VKRGGWPVYIDDDHRTKGGGFRWLNAVGVLVCLLAGLTLGAQIIWVLQL